MYIHESCSDTALLDVGLVAAFTLMVSNDIRRDICVKAITRLPPTCKDLYEITFYGSKIKGLAPQETMIRGLLDNLLRRGSWPGVHLKRIDGLEDGECIDAEAYMASPESIGCPDCIIVKEPSSRNESGFKPWWLASSIMVVYDEVCGCM